MGGKNLYVSGGSRPWRGPQRNRLAPFVGKGATLNAAMPETQKASHGPSTKRDSPATPPTLKTFATKRGSWRAQKSWSVSGVPDPADYVSIKNTERSHCET